MTADWENGGFAVYVHWPFCAAKCPYCDFNSHVRASVDQEAWAAALAAEIARAGGMTGPRRLDSVFFGGGTPSLMAPRTVAAVLAAIDRAWGLHEGVEVTLEANPTSVESARFQGFAEAGVNRVSMGVQALDDASLRALGRLHTAEEALRAFDVARRHFRRTSFDLIYARQGQSVAAWEAELRRALALGVSHLSLYQLTIEPNTRFGELHARGRLRDLPDAEASAEMYELTQAITAEAGLPAYEISNHAAPGEECRHNLVYWRYGDFVGVGPGAHGRLTLGDARWAIENEPRPEAWLEAARGTAAARLAERLEPGTQALECVLMGLRLREGVDLARVSRLSSDAVDAEALQELEAGGLLERDGNRLRATGRGRLVLNGVLERLLRVPA